MEFQELFADERAVSPVIGVILMVAITVILAAVIGTFVLGLGDQVQNTTPQAQFGFEQSNETYSDGTGSQDVRTVTITHESGDSISESDLDITVNGANAWYLADFTSSNKTQDVWNESADVSAGSSETIVLYNSPGTGAVGQTVEFTSGGAVLSGDYSALFPGDTVRVIYNNPDSDKSATLAKYEVQ